MPGATEIPMPDEMVGDQEPTPEIEILRQRLQKLAHQAEAALCPKPDEKPEPADRVIVRISKTAMFDQIRVDVAFDKHRYVHVATLPLAEIDAGSIYEAVAYRDGRTRDLEERPKTAHWPR